MHPALASIHTHIGTQVFMGRRRERWRETEPEKGRKTERDKRKHKQGDTEGERGRKRDREREHIIFPRKI